MPSVNPLLSPPSVDMGYSSLRIHHVHSDLWLHKGRCRFYFLSLSVDSPLLVIHHGEDSVPMNLCLAATCSIYQLFSPVNIS